MTEIYSKPRLTKSSDVVFEKCCAASMFSGDFPPCETCPYGMTKKDDTNSKCIKCEDYIICER